MAYSITAEISFKDLITKPGYMYTKQEASIINRQFWTSFGQYMAPIPSATGEKVNWVNYKTGEKGTRIILLVDSSTATIAIRFSHADVAQQQWFYEKMLSLKTLFGEIAGENWEWRPGLTDGYGKTYSEVAATLPAVNIFNQQHWPSIISFLKPRLLALDQFWSEYKFAFEQSTM